ncbi:unnamed protein product [Durusdinium trenchii]|uniref:AAA+ ATPase domain-containing protein n=1 Tax=Durusdinium trenchii TaxID=1381693 RepID=A0ABP0KU32_9DINO
MGYELKVLEVADPMPGTQHVEIRAHFTRVAARVAARVPGVPGGALRRGVAGRSTCAKTEWLCGRCENLVFRRHRHLCPRCGALREAGAEARLRRKVEISTVIKALQRDADVREDWLAHCKASDASKDPMKHLHESNVQFLQQWLSHPGLQAYQSLLHQHGLLLPSSSPTMDTSGSSPSGSPAGVTLPALRLGRAWPRRLLLLWAERVATAIPWAQELLESVAGSGSDACGACDACGLRRLWVSHSTLRPSGPWDWLDVTQTQELLGSERDICVLVCSPHLHADAFGVLSGLLLGGGLLVLVAETGRARSPFQSSPFDRRFWHFLQRCPHARLAYGSPCLEHVGEEHENGAAAHAATAAEAEEAEEAEMKTVGLCKTVEQKAALEALLNHVQTTRGSAVALLAPRGRGKSSLLGLLAAALKEDVLVVAPTVSSVVEVFQRAKKALATRAQVLEHHAGAEDWCLEVMESGSTWRISLHIGLPELSATTLLLDEAARFPPAALQAVLMAAADRAARCVVASTVHGYEGTGSGLMRLVEQLQLEVVRLRQPIRWPPEDPLEGLASKTLQLDPEPLPVDRTLYEGLRAEELSVERVRRPVLLQNEEILREVYGLLSIAHYRTGPGDLRMLLDETRLEVFGLWNRRRGVTVTVGTGLCACALLVHEQRGNLKRHDLLAESLKESLGCPGLEESEPKTEEPLRCVRVVRVAVHPELQGRGLGRQLVKELSATLQARGSVDLLGVVFRGPAPRLWRFWRDACGWSARAAPAQKLSLFLRAVSARAEQWMETAKMEAG